MKSGRWISILSVVAFSVSAARSQGVVAGRVMGVTGAPLSADIVQESDAIRDGKKVHHESHGRFYRDSAGRTRVELQRISPPDEGSLEISIFDPVKNTFIVLLPQSMRASVKHSVKSQPEPGDPSYRPPELSAPNTRREGLGFRTIEGFEAKGTRTVWIPEPGRLVHGKPLSSESEVWYSAQLKTALLIRTGETGIWRLTNIHQGDPDPLLFQIPAGYTIQKTEQK
jgi:hypothetical protein